MRPVLENASKYEELIGEVIKLCFFRSLNNLQPHTREMDGVVIRDWFTANIAETGFWEMIRQRYNATQVIWECKNFSELDAGVFHQCMYYMNDATGRFMVLCFRSDEIKKHYYSHIKRIHTEKSGLLLLFNEKDIQVFLRQAINGKIKEDHIREIYDQTVRQMS